MGAMLWVLTEEPYHENSTVIGVFDDLTKAVAAFIAAPMLPPVNTDDQPESWQLEAWRDGAALRHLTIWDPTESISLEWAAGKPVYQIVRHNHVIVEDPLAFDWVNGVAEVVAS